MAKILISMDDRLLRRLDEEEAARGVSRCALICEFVANGLGEPLGPGARPAVRQALHDTRQLIGTVHDPTDSIRIIREMRDAISAAVVI